MDIQYVRLPLRSWSGPASEAPVEENVRRFRALLADPANHPVLVHCFRGVHRSGAYCAIYRMEFEHWPNDRAIAELKACGYDNLDGEEDILGYLERYKPTWRASEETAAEKKRPR
jgi:tyrosine-protein phosphatase SIW14